MADSETVSAYLPSLLNEESIADDLANQAEVGLILLLFLLAGALAMLPLTHSLL